MLPFLRENRKNDDQGDFVKIQEFTIVIILVIASKRTILAWKWNFWNFPEFRLILDNYKVGCVFPEVIPSEFRMRQHREGDQQEDAPHFTNY